MEKNEVHAVELVRKIRDEQAALLASKSQEEVLAFFRAAGQAALAEARRQRSEPSRGEEGA
jgi:hypothetical protein